MARKITHIIIHCSATPNGRPNTIEDIDAWHRQNGWQRKSQWMREFNPRLASVGYHYVIQVDGTVRTGRHPDEIGAHAAGHNSTSLGICLVGTDKFSAAQWAALAKLVENIDGPGKTVCGHRDLPDVHKACPGFDVADWLRGKMTAPAAHEL